MKYKIIVTAFIFVVFLSSCRFKKKDFYCYSIVEDQFRIPLIKPYELFSNLNTSFYIELDSNVQHHLDTKLEIDTNYKSYWSQYRIDSVAIKNDTIILGTKRIDNVYGNWEKCWILILPKQKNTLIVSSFNQIKKLTGFNKLHFYAPYEVFESYRYSLKLPEDWYQTTCN